VPAANVASDVCHRTSDAAVTGNTIQSHTAAAEATARLNAKTMNPPYACVLETGDWDLESPLEGRVPPRGGTMSHAG
jgi:hypothetical protein